MPLPPSIEILPLPKPVRAEITVPGSKSITNRALILAALAKGTTTLQGALWSEDTQVMVECLERLGFELDVSEDPDEPCNRTIVVQGSGGVIPKGGSLSKPLELFVGNAGTAARFLTAMVCLGEGAYRLHGVPRMHERPQAALFEALRQLGYKIESGHDRLPALIVGGGRRPGICFVDTRESSQFASALLLSSRVGGWEIELAGEEEVADLVPAAQSQHPSAKTRGSLRTGYTALTLRVMDAFPSKGGLFQIEPDASSGSYFWACGHSECLELAEDAPDTGSAAYTCRFSSPTVEVAHWPQSRWQIDQDFVQQFEKIRIGSPHFNIAGEDLSQEQRARLQGQFDDFLKHHDDLADESKRLGQVRSNRVISRRTDLGDSIMTAVTLAPLAILPTRFTDLGRLRVQECERVAALRTELTKCGARVEEEGDNLTIWPSKLHGAEIETYNDHRMAMCFAILGLKVGGIKIKNPACVKKTFPNFFQKLALVPPRGLGATILDANNGQPVAWHDLFAA
jgi:3-phosphoshikimate 1-carboxyvinyltransferase